LQVIAHHSLARARAALPALALAAFAALASADAIAQFPDKPITLVVGASAGGGVDAAARLVGRKLSDALGQPVVIDNRPGAFSRIAYGIVAGAPADGHTLLVATATAAIDMAIDPAARPNALRDFTPVATIATTDLVLVVAAGLPANSVSDLVGLARRSARKLNFATPGARTIYHLEGERFKLRAGVDLVHVPYRGLSQALAALMSGEVEIAFSSVPAALRLLQAGKVRALAVASSARSPLLPDVPTMQEAGIDDMEATVWYGILAPVRTPEYVVEKLARAIDDISRTPDYRRALFDMGALPLASTPDRFGRMLRDETAQWSEIVEAAQVGVK
jgi:tripartite-type tricarboxylate transporter receptor subunit TctC